MRRFRFKRGAAILLAVIFMAINTGFAWNFARVRMPEPSVLYDVHGKEIKTLYGHNRVQTPLADISDYVEKAFIAAEDKNFYYHYGIDVMAVLRAVYLNIRYGRVISGGSTITQQTAKNLYLTQERTWSRKIQEVFYTIALESKYSKNQILEMYLNSIYFGEGATGVEAASRAYFGKSASDLSLAESALLAAIPRRPNYYDPYRHPENAKARQRVILSLMVKTGAVSAAQAKKAASQKLVYRRGRNLRGDAPYFTDMVLNGLAKQYGAPLIYGGGLRIYTTLDLSFQRAAQEAYDGVMDKQKPDLQAALAAIDPNTGEIRAMIGGRDFGISTFNRSVESKRQPGSAFKPFLYSAAIDTGFTPASMIMCEPVTFSEAGSPDYTPTDYGSEPYHYRSFTLKEALAVSDNIVAIRLNEAVGPGKTAAWAEKFGFSGTIRPVLSLALGTSEVSPLEMAAAYSVLANGGKHYLPFAVLKVLDRDGRVFREQKPESYQVISPENAYIVVDMMKAVLQPGGTAPSLARIFTKTAAGKTGTTQEYRDAWFVGISPRLSCAVWVGYDSQLKSVGIPGGRIAGPIWAHFMAQSLADYPDEDFEKPPGVTSVLFCMDTGQLATEYCPRTIEGTFISGSEPQEFCYLHQPRMLWQDWWNQENGNNTDPGIQEQGNRRSTVEIITRFTKRVLGKL